MKFVRFGSMSLQKQTHYKEPRKDMWPCSPPCKKGLFAFPAGYLDPFYLPLSRPPEHPHSLLQYLRDENGAKLTRRDLFRKNPMSSLSPEDYIRYAMLLKEMNGLSLADSFDKALKDCNETFLSDRGQEILRKKRLKKKQLFWVKRSSYVMIRSEPEKDLTFYGLGTDEEDRTRLNQKLDYLLDPCGEKIEAEDFYKQSFLKWFPGEYEGDYYPPEPDEDYDSKKELYYPDGRSVTIPKWLEINHVKPEELCVWPCFVKGDDEYAATLKKYHVFDYEGCLWHHLGMFLKPGEILSRFSDTWVYTDMHAYQRALKRSDGQEFKKNMKYQREMGRPGYFGAYTYNGTVDQSMMYEVFFDQKIS